MAKKSGSNLFRKWSGKRTRRPLSLTLVMLMALGVAGTAWAADEETGRTYAMIMTESDVTLNDYKGKDVYFWKHDISNPSQLQGGFVTVIKAGKQKSGDNARITLVTDHSGLDLANETAVKAILKSLADKLTYSAYIEGEKNLDGSVSIYEGLTFASASMKTSALDFNETTGKAVITEVKTPFTAVLGEDDKEYKERNILQADGTYKFTEDTIIHPDFNITKEDNYARDFASIYATEDTNIDMTGHDLAINMHGNIYNGGGFTSRACGIYVPGKGTITVDHPGRSTLI